MTKRADDQVTRQAGDLCVLDTSRKTAPVCRMLNEYDATPLIGLKVTARHAAVACDGDEDTIELPKLNELMATAAVVRCLMPERLRGPEIKAMRKIMRMTLAELAERMDSKTAVETVSRWESETQPMGGYAEKVLRLLVCETLRDRAPGVAYDGAMISHLRQIDPWRADPAYELPTIEIEYVRLRQKDAIDDAWTMAAAA